MNRTVLVVLGAGIAIIGYALVYDGLAHVIGAPSYESAADLARQKTLQHTLAATRTGKTAGKVPASRMGRAA